ncbi:hypothetical protein B0T20DRAFT_494995 [Sordaria brevicollis]|uniref:Uncharacterized protein n=1 Tax=Sordaria brevicollis TaxID=83679 RepID=A0AAE0PIX2_SORBR|nr:hypothetical protein B0T20DRAFT_494995 [Sordaria brevicollis]
MHPQPPKPPATTGSKPLITDFFKPVHHSEPAKKLKRKLDDVDEPEQHPAKKASFNVYADAPERKETPAPAPFLDQRNADLPPSDITRQDSEHENDEDGIETSKTTVNLEDYLIEADRHRRSLAPSPQVPSSRVKKRPASARLLDDTDGGLAAAFVGYRGGMQHPKSPTPKRTRINLKTKNGKRPVSSRLIDDVDGGLAESMVTAVHDNTPEDDSNAETVKAADSANDNKRDNKNIIPSARSDAPIHWPLSSFPRHDAQQNQSHSDAQSTSSNQPSASPSPLLLPSPVVDLPLVPSSPLASLTPVPSGATSTLPGPTLSP